MHQFVLIKASFASDWPGVSNAMFEQRLKHYNALISGCQDSVYYIKSAKANLNVSCLVDYSMGNKKQIARILAMDRAFAWKLITMEDKKKRIKF